MKTFQLTGRIGNDAQKTQFENKTVIEFSVAENFSYTSEGKKVEETAWHDCKIWRSNGKEKIADYLKKGILVTVEGNLRYSSYEKDGYKFTKAYILVSDIQIC